MINKKCARRYCCEDISLIENYAEAIADKTQTWDCHHRAEILPCGKYTIEQLEKHGLYWNVPASQLIFLTHSEHTRIHHAAENNPMYGKHHSSETRAKMCEAKSGDNNPMYGKKFSEEHRAKISAAVSGENNPMFGRRHSEETRAKMSAALTGKKFSEEHRAALGVKTRAKNLGRHWWNNGVECRFCKECPEGFVAGMLRS